MKHRVWIFLVLVITCMTAAVLADGFSSDSGAVEEAALSVLKLTVYDQSGESIATGSGFIMFDNMTLVTNYHVIEDAHTITAESDEGYSYDLRSVLIGSKQQDIAILRMKTPTVMRPLPYSTDPLHRAQKVIAIGSPKGIKNTVSVGIISNTVYSDMYFQHTAATSSGSSGGALFNDNGEVVGITSALRNDGNDIYLAIPIGRAVALYEAWDRTTAVAIADYERANADGQNIPATAMETGWLAESSDYISLWTQNDEKYLEDVGTSFDLRQLGSDEYVAPCYYLQNDSSQRHEVVCYWLIDGEQIEFEDDVLDSGDHMICSLSRETASEYGVGSHCAEIYVNGQKVREFSWTITAGSDAPSVTGATYDKNLTGWLRDATIDVALWTQNADRYIEQVGDEYGLEGLGSGEYVAPRLRVTNHSSGTQTAVIKWVIDGDKLTWLEGTIEAGDTFSTSLDETDTDYFTPGVHEADFYVNDTHVASYRWVLTQNGSGVDDWLQTASVSISLWRQDDDNFYADMGDSYMPSGLTGGEYVAPRLYVTNNSSVQQTASVYWMIDGEKITFNNRKIEPGEQLNWTLIQETAREYEAAGTHTMEAYVNERLMTTYTWTVTQPVATPTPEPDWLQTATIEISLWSRDDEHYIKDIGNSYTLSALGSGVYVVPRLFVTNNSSINQSASVYWMIDGNKISFSDTTLEPAEQRGWSLPQSTARKYETDGAHTAKVYINDRLMKTYTWTVKAHGATATPEPDWLQTATIEISLWSQDDERYIKDLGDSYTPSELESEVYVAPRLYVTNNSSINQSASVYWMIDGNKISFSDATLEPAERKSWSLSQSTARKYETAGTHTAEVYINDRLMKTYTWTVKSSSSSSRAQVVPVTNGTILIKPSYKEQCRFTVTVDSSTNFYVYLKYQGIPANTRLRRETSGLSTPESDVAFYVRAGQEVSIRVPIGEYRLYYACGKDFYGTKLLFGDDTRCYQMDEMVCFYSDDEYYYGNSLTLHAPASNAESIGRADFPTR